MPIKLNEILHIENPQDYKVHLSGKHTPSGTESLDVFVEDKEEWKRWNEYKPEKDDFNRKYIFSLIDFYPEPDTWLFGGIFEVIDRLPAVKKGTGYRVELSEICKNYIGLLKLHGKRGGRAKARNYENCMEGFTLVELLKTPYTG